MKFIASLIVLVSLTGCASHAVVDMPDSARISDESFQNKSIAVDLHYRQPEPGVFATGGAAPFKPIKDAPKSVGAANVLQAYPIMVSNQLPSGMKSVDDANAADYVLKVELTSHDKSGPVYDDYELFKTIGKKLITIGWGSSEHELIADFAVHYVLTRGGVEIYSKSYSVKDSVDHDIGLGNFGDGRPYLGKILEKHTTITLQDFFKEAAAKL